MWNLNADTDKWIRESDVLSKDNYEYLKQDLQKVRLWSKCLSGSTYLSINSLDDIYEALNYKKDFDVVDGMLATPDNYVEFYERYLKDSAFTLKTLFTTSKLIDDQLRNYLYADVATTEEINIGLPIYALDGVILKEGHRVLVKDQVSEVTISSTINPDIYFSNEIRVSNYFELDNVGSNVTYRYYNSENGLYEVIGNRLVKTTDLNDYDISYKYSISVKLGDVNRDRQFHLLRMTDGYYPTSGENMEFSEKHNWVLRNRVDYNNVYDLNYYDILHHGPQTIVSGSVTYSIPERTVAVGEFGVIINNQDFFPGVSTYSVSNVIDNKYKLNLNSIEETTEYYWVCGNEGTLLKVSKTDFSIGIVELNELSSLMSVSFFDDLRGMVVGKFNTVYYTSDGGFNWEKITFPEFDSYSYNRVVYNSLNSAYVGGETGVFIEFTNSVGGWTAVKRRISKELTNLDEYLLVDDINDMCPMKWTGIDSTTYSIEENSSDFARSLVFNNRLVDDFRTLEISVDTSRYGSPFNLSQFYIAAKITDLDSVSVYENDNYTSLVLPPDPFDPVGGYNLYFTASNVKLSFTVSLPLVDGILKDTGYHIETNILYDWDGSTSTVFPALSQTYSVDYYLNTRSTDLMLMSTNNSNVIVYDRDRFFSPIPNNFVYFTFTQSFSDIKTITKSKVDSQVYVGGDRIYSFNFTDIYNIGTSSNAVGASYSDVLDLYANRLYSSQTDMYLAGNNSVLNRYDYSTSFDLDPTFNERIKSRLLFLDYDIASKLNFFTDEGDYRLPETISFSQSSMTNSWSSMSVENISGELNWLNYYKDVEKVYSYGYSIDDANKVVFSSAFSFATFSNKQLISGVYTSYSDISMLAPGLNSATHSRTTTISPTAPSVSSTSAVWFYKYLVVFKQGVTWDVSVGDVLYLESDVVDTTFLVNRIFTDGGYNYIYCYSDLNNSIINSLRSTTSDIYLTNLNRYDSIPTLLSRFENHPVSYGYSLAENGNLLEVSARFNNKTSYYNMQSMIKVSLEPVTYTVTGLSNTLVIFIDSIPSEGDRVVYVLNGTTYTFTFREFPTQSFDVQIDNGSVVNNITNLRSVILLIPTIMSSVTSMVVISNQLNISFSATPPLTPSLWSGSVYLSEKKRMSYRESFLDFGYSPTFNLLNYLNKVDSVFDSSKVFYGFASFDYLQAGELTDDSVWFDYSISTNKLYFGKNLNYQWTSLLKWTFVDVTSIYSDGSEFQETKLLIVDKYYDSTTGSYVIELNKKLPRATTGPLASQNVYFLSIRTRRTLQQISEDLQILNNIQRSSTQREIQVSYNVTNLENEINFKFPTDSYFKGIIADSDIRKRLSGIVYTDSNSQIAMNVINLDQVIELDISSVYGDGGYAVLNFGTVPHNLIEGNGFLIAGSSDYVGWNTVIEVIDPSKIKIDRLFVGSATGKIFYTKKDPFLNYQPIDLFDYGSDQKVTRSVEIRPENVVLTDNRYSIVNLDLTKYKISFVDGLYLDEVERNYPWFLEAEVSDAVVGKDNNGLVWYSGIWHCGRWFGGTWLSGQWIGGDWYSGIWKSLKTTFRIISVDISDTGTVDNSLSKWYGGRWFDGTWYGGTWYNGRRYAGDWSTGLWYNGVWNDGRWIDGVFGGGIWVRGTWDRGTFNSNSKPSYWLDGEFRSGDFENGMWYDGKFGNTQNLLSRFGTKSTNSRTTVWHGGDWLNGQFHSRLNTNSQTGQPAVSDIHKYSVWYTGNWYGGDFWGGVAYNINFLGGTWHGGILEEIQVCGIDMIEPSASSTNAIVLNGIFRFNVGDVVWIIDDDRSTPFSPIGNNDNPTSYRINKTVLDTQNKQTKIYLNYNLSTLGVDPTYASATWSSVETGLRVVSYFKNSVWESGIWTNGVFESGDFKSGIWYNGIFSANWGS